MTCSNKRICLVTIWSDIVLNLSCICCITDCTYKSTVQNILDGFELLHRVNRLNHSSLYAKQSMQKLWASSISVIVSHVQRYQRLKCSSCLYAMSPWYYIMYGIEEISCSTPVVTVVSKVKCVVLLLVLVVSMLLLWASKVLNKKIWEIATYKYC